MLNRTNFAQAVLVPRLFLRALFLTWQADRRLTLLTLGLVLFSALMTPLHVWISKVLIDGITAAAGQGITSADDPRVGSLLLLPLALYVSIWMLGQLSDGLDLELRRLLNVKADNHIRRMLFTKAATLDMAFYESPAFYDLFTVAKDEMYRASSVTFEFISLIRDAVTVLALFSLLGQFNIWLPVIVFVTALPRLFGVAYFTRQKANLYLTDVPVKRLKYYLAWLMGERDSMKEIRLFQLHDYLIGRMDQASQTLVSDLRKLIMTQEKSLLLLNLIMAAGIAFVWAYAGVQALIGVISLGSVALIFQAAERSRDSLLSFANTSGFFAENTIYLHTLFKFLDLSPDAVVGALARSPESAGAAADLNGVIQFDRVYFRYPGHEEPVLKDISFSIQAGETVALVGENGAGKTTLVKLLTRLYDPSEGTITIAGRDLRQVDPQRYHQQIGVIFQDFRHYELTVRENIGFGNLAEVDNLARVRRAAEMGGAAEMIDAMPRQYETVLGRLFYEDSKDLSGGEWQRIALARAFMRDVPLLILDEPTAALDAFAENAVYNRFAELTKGRTTIFVTHRLSSVQMAQKILVLKQGRLIEVGSHDELMAHNGEYASMFRIQAER
ncbi:MAG: ABC transporter ATP-binding protein, partial [Anaerolineae bacterium]|nr:ABC transporter ATP-binding protein [Anaerolineae bacterium]